MASPVSLPAASICGWIAHAGTLALVRSAALVDYAPWLVIDVPPPAVWVLAPWYAGWGIVVSRPPHRWIRLSAVPLIVTSAGLLMWMPPGVRAARASLPPAQWTRVAFLDVGQGDATAILLSTGEVLLVDAGGTPGSSFDLGRRVTLPAIWALGVTRLQTLVLTHGDPDHIGGAHAIIRAMRPHDVWEGVPVPRHVPLQFVRTAAMRQHVSWHFVRAGDAMSFEAARIRVLNPPEPDWERQRVRNDDSIVLELRIGDVRVVFPGDISQTVESSIARDLDQARDAMLTFVKAPHHGSATSSSQEFIDATGPAAVIFSAGRRNPFGHPASVVIDRYREYGARIFRTDEDGEVILDTDGRQAIVWTWSGRRETFSAKGPPRRPTAH